MPTVGIVRARAAGEITVPPGGHPKAILHAERGVKLIIPYAPLSLDLGGLADTWERVDRPGRKPLTLRTARRLPTLNMTLTLARPDVQSSIEDLLAALVKLGAAEERVTLSNMSPLARGPWRITDLTITSSAMQYGTNAITRATASLSLVAASDALSRRGPLSGGKGGGGKGGNRYTVKKGDTLRRIAGKENVYGNPNLWQLIAKANGIKAKPGEELKPGRVLTIPPRSGVGRA